MGPALMMILCAFVLGAVKSVVFGWAKDRLDARKPKRMSDKW